MKKISINTSFNIDLEFEGAPFANRLFAWILDVIVGVLYLMLAYKVVYEIGKSSGVSNAYDSWATELIVLFPVLTYHLLFEILGNGQSLGKKIMGLKVVNDQGGSAGIAQYMIRWLLRVGDFSIPIVMIALITGNLYLLKILWVTTIIFLLDFVLMVRHPQGKRLGDIAAGTMLIRVKEKGNFEETIFMDVSDVYVPVFPQVMKLSDRDINTIKMIVDNWKKSKQEHAANDAKKKLEQVLNVESELYAVDFLETLLMDYNYLSTR